MSSPARDAFSKASVLIVVLIAGWQALYWSIGETAMRSPLAAGTYTVSLFSSDMLWPHARESLLAFAFALAIAIAAGLAIGFVLGSMSSVADVFEPMLTAIYSIPKITLYPILLLLFGLGMSAKVAFGAIHGFIPIALFTLNGVRNVRPVLIKAGRTMKLSQLEIMRCVLFPAALPEIFTGLRIGFSLTLIGTLLGEMFASQRGIGFLMMNAIGLHNIDLITALTLLIIIFSATVSSVLLYFDRRLRARL
jgi:NitT/TauT family transport system permease protein